LQKGAFKAKDDDTTKAYIQFVYRKTPKRKQCGSGERHKLIAGEIYI
jgi:hypothetical protein